MPDNSKKWSDDPNFSHLPQFFAISSGVLAGGQLTIGVHAQLQIYNNYKLASRLPNVTSKFRNMPFGNFDSVLNNLNAGTKSYQIASKWAPAFNAFGKISRVTAVTGVVADFAYTYNETDDLGVALDSAAANATVNIGVPILGSAAAGFVGGSFFPGIGNIVGGLAGGIVGIGLSFWSPFEEAIEDGFHGMREGAGWLLDQGGVLLFDSDELSLREIGIVLDNSNYRNPADDIYSPLSPGYGYFSPVVADLSTNPITGVSVGYFDPDIGIADRASNFQLNPFDYYPASNGLINPTYFDDSGVPGTIVDPVNYNQFGWQGGLDFAGVAIGAAAGIAGLGYDPDLASSAGGFSDEGGQAYAPGTTSNETFDTSDVLNYYNDGSYNGSDYSDSHYDDSHFDSYYYSSPTDYSFDNPVSYSGGSSYSSSSSSGSDSGYFDDFFSGSGSFSSNSYYSGSGYSSSSYSSDSSLGIGSSGYSPTNYAAASYAVSTTSSSVSSSSDWSTNATSYSDYNSSYDSSSSISTGSWSYFPVLLDLDGDGFDITPLTSSNFFFDVNDDGHQQRTAWAGAGDAILAYDVDGDGQVTQRKEVVFTEWSPGATDDMQALADVFDTDHDGLLDADDDQFDSFKVMLTNADGTTTLMTLAEAGIASINLTPDASKVVLPDGSTIDGETEFTRDDGTTGKAATISLAADVAGYILEQTVTENDDGSTTIDSKALDPDGSVANQTIGVTSADGDSRTLSFDNDGDGVIDLVQTDVTVTNADGSTTQTLSNENGGGVLLNETITTKSADGNSTTIERDADGDGVSDQSESRVTAADGSTTVTISDLNPDGSLKGEMTSVTSVDGLTNTSQTDLDGDGMVDVIVTDATVVNADDSRTQTVSQTANDGTPASQTVTVRSADGSNKTIETDFDGDGTFDQTRTFVIESADGDSTTTTETDTNADGSLRGSSVVALSADGLSRTTQSDLDADGAFDLTTSDVTVVDADGNRTQTISDTNADGSLRAQSVTVKGGDGISRTVQTDNNGDGQWDQLETIAVDAATEETIDAVSHYNDDGTLNYRSVTTTSADGLTVTTQIDIDGDGTFDKSQTTTTVMNADGSSVVTKADYSADGTLLDRSIITTSADGLSKTTQTDVTGDGSFESTIADITVVNADDSQVRTVTDESADGTLLSESVKTTSADRKTITINTDGNGDGANDTTDSLVTQADGSTVHTVSDFNPDGSLLKKSIATTSDDGLSTTTQRDVNGDGIYDLTTTDVTVLNSDGSRTETISNTNADASLRSQKVITTSANGYSRTVQADSDGDAVFELTTTTDTVFNADGSETTTAKKINADGSLRNQLVTTVSATGLSTTTRSDLDGDGTFDRIATDVTALNGDGSKTETITRRNGDGSLRAQTVTTTSADGRSTSITRDTNGDGDLDQTETITVAENGDVVDKVINLNPDGSIAGSTTTISSADGLHSSVLQDLDGDGTDDIGTYSDNYINADGSTERIVSNYAGAELTVYIGEEITLTSADGLEIENWHDYNGDGEFDIGTYTEKVINADGSTTKWLEHDTYDYFAEGYYNDVTETTISADGRTTTIIADPFAEGLTQFEKTIVEQSDGSLVTTITYPNMEDYDPAYVDEIHTRTVSADGLSKTIYLGNSDIDYMDVSDVTTLNADGSRTQEYTNHDDYWGAYSTTTTTSANGLSKTVHMATPETDFHPRMTLDATDVTAFKADGSTVQTITNTTTIRDTITQNKTTTRTDKTLITTSDDGLTQTTQLDINNDGSFERTDAMVTALDGSSTETITLRHVDTGALLREEMFTTSFDGRSQSMQRDSDGDGVVDHFETVDTNTDGSVTSSIWNTDANSNLLDKFVTITSANGLSKTSTSDTDGDGATDYSQTSTTTLNADGGRTTAVTNYYGNGAVRNRKVSTVSADGFSETTRIDMNGDGVVDETLTDVTVLNDDGSTIETISEFYADGSLKSQTTIEKWTTAYGTNSSTDFDDDGDGNIDRNFSLQINQDGYRIEDMTFYNADGSVDTEIHSETTVDGLERVTWAPGTDPDDYPETSLYFMPNANGSYIWDKYNDVVWQTATHTIDPNGIDNWVWINDSISNWGVFHTTVIDLDSEKRAVETARRLYDAALDRTMAENEVQLLAQYISAGMLDTETLADELVTSTEFADKYGTLTDLQFVERIYQNALGHAAPLSELTDLVGQLNDGTLTRVDVLNLISESQEHKIVGNGHMVTNNSHIVDEPPSLDHTTDEQIAGDIVRRLYDTVLDRSVDASGLATYSTALLDGSMTEAEIADTLIGSAEFASNYGSLTDAAFVERMFQNALERAPTAEESSFWTSALDDGTVSRADLADGIAQSREHLSIMGAGYSYGGAGDDTVFAPDSAVTIDGAAGINTADYRLLAQPGVTVDLVAGQATKANGNVDQLTNIRNVVGSTGDDILLGNLGDETLSGGAGADTLNGGTGDDRLYGGGGDDRYIFEAGGGADIIQDVAGDDRLTFEGAINPTDLWFAQEGQNLVISRLGTTDSVTIGDWFTSSNGQLPFQVEEIEAADGTATLHAGDVNSLISQIAAFSAQVGSDPSAVQPTDLPEDYQVAVNAVWQTSA